MSKIRILVALLTTAVMALTIASCGKDVEKKESGSKADVSSVATEDSKTEDKDSTADTENDETSESKSNDDNSTDGDSSVVKGTGIVIEDFINLDEWEDENVVIIGGGTSNPYFSTDTASALRGIEIEAEVMFKGTRVDGVYTADPEKDPTATKFDEITYDEVLQRGLKVMDITATAMCKENKLPIYVFNMDVYGNLAKVLEGEPIGTLVY